MRNINTYSMSAFAVAALGLPATVGTTEPEPPEATYVSTSFVMPFEVTLPDWVAPAPSEEQPNFVTWEGTDVDRAIRVVVPVTVLPPGETDFAPVPEDYVAYLLAQSDHGAVFEDVTETTVDGRPATVLTATAPTEVPDSLGCDDDDPFEADCWGLLPDLILRLAVIDTEGGPPLLIWLRESSDSAEADREYDSFDAMLEGFHFRPDATPTSQPPDTIEPGGGDPRLPDGTYRTPELTRDQLIASGVAAGFAEEDVTAFVDGPFVDGQVIEDSVVLGLRLEGGNLVVMSSYDGGPEGPIGRGTYEIVDDDTVIATDEATPVTYTFDFDGEQVTFDMVDCPCDLVAQIALTVIYETAPFTLETPEGTATGDGEARLPEGIYRTPELTRDQLIATGVAAGFADEDVTAILDGEGIEGTVVWGLRLADGGWWQLYSYDGGPESIGWEGTYEVVDDDTVIATDPSSCSFTHDYVFDGQLLTLDVVAADCAEEYQGDELVQTIIFETAPFTLEEPAAAT